MKIKEKVMMDINGLYKHGPITIVAFGDSVTHGSFDAGEHDYVNVYHRRLANMINEKYNYVPVNVINAGIGGTTAKASLARMESQVFSHSPDLVIVAFGLNDVNGTLDDYLNSLKIIFENCKARDIETVFMTPNMLNTYVSDRAPAQFKDYAHVTAEYQNSGRMDEYMNAAVKLANDMDIKVADCYAKWKKLAETEDTTALLANAINHPTRELHKLVAETLDEVIFCGNPF